MEFCCNSFNESEFEIISEKVKAERGGKMQERWVGYIFLQFIKDQFGIKGDSTTPTGYLLCDQFKGEKSTTGIPLGWSTFDRIIAHGMSVKATEKILEHAAACKGLTLGELLRDLAAYYIEKGSKKIEYFKIACRKLLGDNS